MREKSLKHGMFSLVVISLVIWGVMAYALPMVTNSFEATRQLADYIDASGIETGQFYYTGIEITGHAESGARASIAHSSARKAFLESRQEEALNRANENNTHDQTESQE